MEKKFATREALDSIDDLPTVDLFVPEWDCWVKIRTMTGPERDYWENSRIEVVDGEPKLTRDGQMIRLCAICLAGEDGKPLYGIDHQDKLKAKSGPALYRIFDKAFEWNKLGRAGIEDAEKKSGSAPGGASSSGSPANGIAPLPNCLPESTAASLPS